MSTATRSIEVDVSPEKMFDVLADFKAYPGFLSHLGMEEVQIDSDDGNVKVVTHAVKKMGMTSTYTLRYQLDRPRKISWTFVKGKMMKDNKGSWVVEEAGEGKCKATYSAEVKFGLLVPNSLVTMMISKELPEMLETFKKRAEAS
jgi:coenzyme Q-binding protein COQ10